MAKSKPVLGVEILGETARLVLADIGENTITPVLSRTVTGAENLAKTLRGLPRRPGAVVCSVPMEQAAVRILNLPPTTDENLERVVTLEAEGALPMGTEDLALAHQSLGLNEQSRMEVLLAAARQDAVQRALARVNVAPYISSQANLTPIALVNALQQLRGAARENVCAILKIEEGYSELVVLERNRVLAAQSLQGGTHSGYDPQPITDRVAEPVTVGAGVLEPAPSSSGLGGPVYPWLQSLAYQTRYALQAICYERGLAMERLYVCGAGAALPSVDWQLSEALDFPVTLLTAEGSPEGAEYAAAFGCAVQAAGLGAVALNLTPTRVTIAREVEQRRQNTLSWGALAGAAAVAIALIFGAAVFRKNQELTVAEAQLRELGGDHPRPPMQPNELKKVSDQVKTVLEVRVPPAKLIESLNASLPAGSWLAEVAYNSDTGATVRGASTNPAGPQQAQIELLKTGLFDEVALNYVTEDDIGGKRVWLFEIGCRLRPKEVKRGVIRR